MRAYALSSISNKHKGGWVGGRRCCVSSVLPVSSQFKVDEARASRKRRRRRRRRKRRRKKGKTGNRQGLCVFLGGRGGRERKGSNERVCVLCLFCVWSSFGCFFSFEWVSGWLGEEEEDEDEDEEGEEEDRKGKAATTSECVFCLCVVILWLLLHLSGWFGVLLRASSSVCLGSFNLLFLFSSSSLYLLAWLAD